MLVTYNFWTAGWLALSRHQKLPTHVVQVIMSDGHGRLWGIYFFLRCADVA